MNHGRLGDGAAVGASDTVLWGVSADYDDQVYITPQTSTGLTRHSTDGRSTDQGTMCSMT